MAQKSKIEWTEATWNPIVGCSIVSPGCTNCYAMKMAARLNAMGVERYVGLTKPSKAGAVWTGEMKLAEEALTIPLRRKKPTTWFVNSMSDLFHESVPDAWIDRVFAVMGLAGWHTYQVLTKRSARMRAYITNSDTLARINAAADAILDAECERADRTGSRPLVDSGLMGTLCMVDGAAVHRTAWPFPGVWLGVSAEDQRRADERVPDLLATPAAVRFVSAEPLLGPIDFTRIEARSTGTLIGGDFAHPKRINALTGWAGHYPSPTVFHPRSHRLARLAWIITGGESGPNARPANPQWTCDILGQCEATGTAYLHKQNGEWVSVSEVEGPGEIYTFPDGRSVRRVGKRKAGRTIDGKTHDGFPGDAR